MANEQKRCFIWDTPVTITGLGSLDTIWLVQGSRRAGGDYRIADLAIQPVAALDEKGKARLTTKLLDLRQQGERQPLVTCELVEDAERADPLAPYVRAERLLRYLVSRQESVGRWIETLPTLDDPKASAWSESTEPEDVPYFLNYLTRMEWLDRFNESSGLYKVSVFGYERVAEQARQTDSSQCFVAMWFDDSMTKAYEEGIKKAIKECGYTPMKINEKPHFNKICDEAIAEIRRSGFVVADFTHGDDGARGSVFYEAGFAHALGLQVIFTCRKGHEEKLHFDTRQYPHILWEDEEDLYARLRHKIGALSVDHKGEPVTL